MQTASFNHQTSGFKSEPQYKTIKRKTKTMFLEFLRKLFWMKFSNHGHSIHNLSDHLKRDMGLIEQDFNPKPRQNNRHSSKIRPNIWL